MKRRVRVAVLIPGLLVGFGALDVSARVLVRLDRTAFRAWEAVTVGRTEGRPFAPNKKVVVERAWGDLANMAGFAVEPVFRTERFTTDSYGFRNEPEECAGSERNAKLGILTGSSNAVGAGISDEDTVARRLGDELGGSVYSAAGMGQVQADDLLQLAARVRVKDGFVFVEHFERGGEPVGAALKWERATLAEGSARVKASLAPFRVSRLRFLQRFLPEVPMRRFSGPVRVGHLRGGPEILLFEEDIEASSTTRLVSVHYYRELNVALRRAGLRLIVFLVPTKFSVYQPLLEGAERPATGGKTLEILEHQLRREGVRVVNLKGPLRDAAMKRMPELIYFADDSHWNAAGARVVARALAKAARGYEGDHAGVGSN